MITIDGSYGEGGGQILRSSLALSLVTGKPFRMERIRSRRKKPGLQAQHLTAVRAAAEVGRAEVEGAAPGSSRLTFVPQQVQPGEYEFATGTAGSTTLVLQTVLPALMLCPAPSRVALEGGTHNINAPPFDFLTKAFLPLLGRMGLNVEAALQRAGFYPAGGGRLTVDIRPPGTLRPLDLVQRGRLLGRAARGIVARLPPHIAQREVRTALESLDWPDDCGAVEEVPGRGPGNVLLIEIHSEEVVEVFTGFGQKGVAAETVARQAAAEARRYLASDVPVGQHLADQLLLPMALARGGRFRTLAPSQHTRTNIETLRRFLDVRVTEEGLEEDAYQISVD